MIAFAAGKSVSPGKRAGHAGTIIMGRDGNAQNEIDAFKTVGTEVAKNPDDITRLLFKGLGKEKHI